VALTQVIVFAVLQGLTAIFPIGAGAHSALLRWATGWDTGPVLDAAAEVGILLAVMVFFWRDLFDMAYGLWRTAKGKRDPGARLAFQLIVASIPAIALAFVAEHYVSDALGALPVIGWMSVGAALLLAFFDRMSMTVKRLDHATYVDTLLVGLCQVFALLPGASRASATMTMARLLGYERDQAVRLSMLLAIPLLIAVLIKDLWDAGMHIAVSRLDVIASAISFVFAFLSVGALSAWLKRGTFTPFVIYRLLVGAAVVVLAYGWMRG
jgi:undecaprenyl-diphosphatase